MAERPLLGWRLIGPGALLTCAAASAAADLPSATTAATVTATVTEPRAFGYTVGDVVTRRIALALPAGFTLDENSLPQPGGRGQALELRGVHLGGRGAARELRLEYQVFLSPRELRTLEMPAFALTFTGSGVRPQSVRIDAWPVVVAPLVPVEPPAREGLGELRPDTAPPLIDTRAIRARLWIWAAGLVVVFGFLAQVYLFIPWWARRHRPFGMAWRRVNLLPPAPAAAQRQAAYRQVHDAINRTAGGVLFEAGLDRWLAAQPRFAPLRGEMREFFQRSRGEFFAASVAPEAVSGPGVEHGGVDVDVERERERKGERNGNRPDRDADLRWLLRFTRRCRDAERGSA